MPSIRSFEELDVWKLARALNSQVYRDTSSGAFSKDYGLRDQIRRASVSVMANIAEGFERDSKAEFVHFLRIAKASAGEVKSHLYTAEDIGYMPASRAAELRSEEDIIMRKIGSFITYLLSDMKRTRTSSTREPRSDYGVAVEIAH